MTYGLSRDDAGKFMSDYVKQGVFPEDPFHTLDTDGVGELLMIGAERGRAARPDLILSICGEHGGNAESIAFCRSAGFDYVSCSPSGCPWRGWRRRRRAFVPPCRRELSKPPELRRLPLSDAPGGVDGPLTFRWVPGRGVDGFTSFR